MFNNDDLSWYRNYFEDNTMPGTAIIIRNSSGSLNEYYEYVEGTAAASTVSCRFDPYQKMDSSQMVGERDASRNWYRLTLPHDVDVQSDDIVKIGGVDHQIIQLHEDHSYHMVTRLIIAKVE